MLYFLLPFMPLILCSLLANGMVSSEGARRYVFCCIVKWKEGEIVCDHLGFVFSGAFFYEERMGKARGQDLLLPETSKRFTKNQ